MAAAGGRAPVLIMAAIRRAFADLSIGQVHYARCGDSRRPVVLLLHQTPRSWAEYREVLPLIGEEFCAIAIDTPGFGDSAPLPGSACIESWAQVAVELLDALSIAKAHVVGHHTGGVIAMEIAATFPTRVASLVLSSTPFTDDEFRRARREHPPIDAVEPRPDGSHLTALWQRRQPFYPQGRPDLLEAFVRDALKVSGEVEAGHRAVASYRMEQAIGRIVQPTLLIRASDDPFASPHIAALQAHLREASVVTIEGGMVPMPDQLPQAFANALLVFIRAQSSSVPPPR